MSQDGERTLVAGERTALIFGVLAGIGGLTHGVGEIRQGNIPTNGPMIDSWTSGPIATHMGGDPALTVIPNVLATGILALTVSAAMIIWSIFFISRKHGGRNLILLSVLLLLVGGGVGSPIIGLLAGWAGTTIHAPLTRWRRWLPARLRMSLARLWPWAFGLAIASGALLVLGAPLLIYTIGVGNADFYFGVFLFTVLSLLITDITGIAYDIVHHRTVHHSAGADDDPGQERNETTLTAPASYRR